MRSRLAVLLAGLCVAAGGLCTWVNLRRTPARPNVLLISVDTLRADRLGCYGGRVPTPEMDALARRGARFPVAVAHAPLTAPSHASLLTGLLPPRHGVRDNGAFVLPEGPLTLAQAFAGAGWRTAAFVSGFPLDRRFGFGRGFERFDDRLPRGQDARRAEHVERRGDATADAFLAWLAGLPTGREAAPWLAFVHFFDPHAPYEAPGDLAARAGGAYEGEVAFVDAQVGRLLAALLARGESERTLVLLTSDHGESLGEHGERTHGVFVYDSTLRVPLLVAGPGVSAGATPAAVARGVDVLPTLLDLAGLPAPAGLDGRSLRPALEGRPLPDAPAYAESLFCARALGWAPLHAWRSATHKLVLAPRVELYDLDRDPAEAVDLAGREAERVAELRRPLEALLARAVAPVSAAADPAATERLRALGYLGGGAAVPVAGSGRDPKQGLALVNALEDALTLLRADPAAAERQLDGVLREEPGLPLALRSRALARNALGQPAAALGDVERLKRSAAPSAETLELESDTLRLLGRHAEAARAADAAAALMPGSATARLLAARAWRAQGRLSEAQAAFAEALKAAPENPEALRGLAELALEQGDAGGAEGLLQRALAADPADPASLRQLGLLLARTGRAAEALGLFEQAVSSDPRDPDGRLALAAALARTGRPAEAVPHFEAALAAGRRSPQLLNGLGFARLEAGDRKGALEALRASLALDPRQPEIARALEELGGDRR